MAESEGLVQVSDSKDVPVVVIEPSRGWASLQLRAVWKYREPLLFLVWRDVKVRYKQTALGVAWIVLPSLLSTAALVIFGVLMAGVGARVARAQEAQTWSPPLELSAGVVDGSGQPFSSMYPALVADAQGRVHAFWTVVPRVDDTIQDGMIFYSRWDGVAWTAPIDVLVASRRPMWLPQAAIDAENGIHLVWMYGAGGTLWYSSAAAGQAGSAKGWSKPQQLSDLSVTGAAVAAGGSGRVYVVFCSGKEDDQVYFVESDDSMAWSSPTTIGEGCDDCIARLAVDAREGLHVAFGSQFSGAQGVHYARSLDGGATWSVMQVDQLDDRYRGGYGPNLANVLATGDEVHFVWDGAPAGDRWHQWSGDRGETWSTPQQISPDQRGLTLPVAMVVDSAGTLHLVSMGWRDIEGRPCGAFHFYWRGGRWSEPVLIGDRTDWNAEYPALAMASGNVLVAAWTDKGDDKEDPFQIWVSSLQVDAPRLPAAPIATLPVMVPTAAATATVQAVRTPSPTSFAGAQSSPPAVAGVPSGGLGIPATSGFSATAVGILCSIAVVVVVVVLRRLLGRPG
jgi:hypothetical protein